MLHGPVCVMNSKHLRFTRLKTYAEDYLSLVLRKLVLGVPNNVRHKPGWRKPLEMIGGLEILDSRRRGIVLFMVAKTKALISCVVGADQLCGYHTTDLRLCFSHMQKSWFSQNEDEFSQGKFNYISIPEENNLAGINR